MEQEATSYKKLQDVSAVKTVGGRSYKLQKVTRCKCSADSWSKKLQVTKSYKMYVQWRQLEQDGDHSPMFHK